MLVRNQAECASNWKSQGLNYEDCSMGFCRKSGWEMTQLTATPFPVLNRLSFAPLLWKIAKGKSPYGRQMPTRSTKMQTYLKSLKRKKGALMLDHPAILQCRLRKARYLYILILATGKQYLSSSLPNGIHSVRPLMSSKVSDPDWCTYT